MKIHRSVALVLALATGSACLSIDQGGTRPMGPTEDEVEEDRRDTLGIECEAILSITGSFAVGEPQPVDVSGCWPVGTWTFTASVVENDCPGDPALEAQYQFEVTRDIDENYVYTYLNDPSYERVLMKVTSGGGGLCEGGFEIFSLDGRTVTNLKPALQADNTINGFGEHTVYDEDQWAL